MSKNKYVLRLTAVDSPGIIHELSGGIVEVGGNIIESAQFADEPSNSFNVRITFESPEDRSVVWEVISIRLSRFDPVIQLRNEHDLRKALVMVSKLDHCLDDLLYRYSRNELPIEIPVIVSNHEDLREKVEGFGIPFVVLPVERESKSTAEKALIEIVQKNDVDFIVLARYMQILSDEFCSKYSGRIINIHHSFLPSFKGAKPYHQAYARGVKLIGATAHFVTADLDEGPIIGQNVVPVDHTYSADELVVLGRDVERTVLSQAVKLHAEDRVFLNGNRTVVMK